MAPVIVLLVKRDESLLAQAKETLVASNVEWEAWSKGVLAL